MPQLQFWHFLPQFFWLAVCFTVLYVVMATVALPRIGGVLAQRKEKIETDLEAAERAGAEADAALEAYDRSLVEARESAHRTIGAASQEAAKAAETRNKELDAEVARQIEEAGRAIAAQKAEAMESLSTMAAEAARSAARKLAGIEVGEAEAQGAVAAAREG